MQGRVPRAGGGGLNDMAILSLLMNTEQLAQDLRAGGVPVMLKAAGCPRVATAMLVAIALICQGCSFGGHRSSGTTIGPEGGHAATAFASVDAPAGAVTKLTKLHLTKGGADPLGGFSPDAGSMLDTPSGSIQVDLSGAQPQKPLTLSVPVPAGMDGTKAVLLTTHDGKPEALPTTPGAAGWVQASVSHLSPFRIAFLNFDKVGAFFRDAALFLGSAVGAAGTAQACANQPLQLAGGGTLSITGPTSPISVCLTSDSGGMHVSAQSADALPWRVRISKGTYDGAAEVSTSNVALQTAYNQLVKDRRFSEGLLAPQGKGSWHLTDDVADVTMQASVSTGMWLTSAVIFSAVYLFQVFTGAATKGVTGAAAAVKTVIDRGGYLDCFSSAVGAVPEGKILTAQQIGKLTKAGIDCAGPLIEQMGGVVSGLAAVVLTALGAGVAVVVSGFEGAFRTIKEPILTWHITTTGRPAPSQDASSTISVDGLGGIRYGMSLQEAEAAIGGSITTHEAGAGPSCLQGQSDRLPGAVLAVRSGVITAGGANYSSQTDTFRTPEGFHYGTPLPDIQRAHPGMNHRHYDRAEGYTEYDYVSPGGNAMSFIIDDASQTLTSIDSGPPTEIVNVESICV